MAKLTTMVGETMAVEAMSGKLVTRSYPFLSISLPYLPVSGIVLEYVSSHEIYDGS